MIVLCPKVFASAPPDSVTQHHKEFLEHYLTIKKIRATVANEVWDNWRHKIKTKYGNIVGDDVISHRRGLYSPEVVRLNQDFTEVEPKPCDDVTMLQKTISLANRRWLDIDYLIVDNPLEFSSVGREGRELRIVTLSTFWIEVTSTMEGRLMYEAFCQKCAVDKV
jgi:hypothetical protein